VAARGGCAGAHGEDDRRPALQSRLLLPRHGQDLLRGARQEAALSAPPSVRTRVGRCSKLVHAVSRVRDVCSFVTGNERERKVFTAAVCLTSASCAMTRMKQLEDVSSSPRLTGMASRARERTNTTEYVFVIKASCSRSIPVAEQLR
jgi:hypothetical protein